MVSLSPEQRTNEVASQSAIEARGLTAAYGDLVVLSRVSFSVPLGSLCSIVGPARAGKSTLVRLVLGMQAPRAGHLLVLGRSPTEARRLLGYVPQNELADWRLPLSVADVVAMGRYSRVGLFRRPGSHDRELVAACLEQVGLGGVARRRAAELDGGQRRRALLARALVQEPEVLLIDELFEGLDIPTRDALFKLVDRLHHAGKTVVLATRHLAGVAQQFERAVLINGQVVAEGPPGEIFSRANLEATYGSESITAEVGAAYYAVDVGSSRR